MSRRRGVSACFLIGLMMVPSVGRAEEGEWGTYAFGGLLFPNFAPEDPVAFDLVTGFGGLGLTHGVLDDLWVDLRFSMTDYGARRRDQVPFRGQVLAGDLFFNTTQFHLEAGCQYNLYPGLDFSPYIFVRGGALFSIFRNQQLLDDQGRSFAGLTIDNASELQATVSGGLSLEYRFFEFMIAGVEPTFTKALGPGRHDWWVTTTAKFALLFGL